MANQRAVKPKGNRRQSPDRVNIALGIAAIMIGFLLIVYLAILQPATTGEMPSTTDHSLHGTAPTGAVPSVTASPTSNNSSYSDDGY